MVLLLTNDAGGRGRQRRVGAPAQALQAYVVGRIVQELARDAVGPVAARALHQPRVAKAGRRAAIRDCVGSWELGVGGWRLFVPQPPTPDSQLLMSEELIQHPRVAQLILRQRAEGDVL